MHGRRPRWGRVWGIPLPVGVEVNFSEYSIVISAPQCSVLPRPLRIGEYEDCCGEAAE